jgi:hypothetical protein
MSIHIQGWFPLYDTMKGMRGSLKVAIKLQFIGNANPFRDSSAGIQFFTASSLAQDAFIIEEILGFVVDLVVEDDAESSWQDYFRKASKASNDNRLETGNTIMKFEVLLYSDFLFLSLLFVDNYA